MATDYTRIAEDRERLERTAKNSIRTLANLYAEREHFVFELLQNAEDALRRRTSNWRGSRAVEFSLSEQSLRVSHFGATFNELNVEAICSVGDSTKEITDIGHFGIGFKSVYAFTDRPQVHSGSEDFAIEDSVRPVTAPKLERDPEETVILIPLKKEDVSAHDDIARGLANLGASTLLFLHQIEEIHWNVEGADSGVYLREVKDIEPRVRCVTVIGEQQGGPRSCEDWLIFSSPIVTDDGYPVGQVEIAFSHSSDAQSSRECIQRIERSPLVVFFPTVLESHLGFRVQGPYRTTPSRENVPRENAWNQRILKETASLLPTALRWLRDRDLLDAAALRCFPLESSKFGETSMFRPLYEVTKMVLTEQPLLPRFDSGHVSAKCARLGRTQELRDLLTPAQLSDLFHSKEELVWLSGDITQDRMPDLRRYLTKELGIAELTPDTVIPELKRDFLEAQPDDWIRKLYEFLNGQPGQKKRFEALPLIRLEDGTHVTHRSGGQPQAFLPGPIATGFPIVRTGVCASATSLDFLRSLGLTEPNPVDDVVRNVLPKYRVGGVTVSDADYEADVSRILNAFGTDSKVQRDKLLNALHQTPFVKTIDAGDGSRTFSNPENVYREKRLKNLFQGVTGVLLLDDDCPCLVGEAVRDLLEACGATRNLQPVPCDSQLGVEELRRYRVAAGCENMSSQRPIEDKTLRGLGNLLTDLPNVSEEDRARKGRLLWEALGELEERRGRSAFSTTYSWQYHTARSTTIDASFVRTLNETPWVQDANGDLQRPEFVLFDTLGWNSNPFLQSKIHFKPPILDQLAIVAGIDPEVLELLKKRGLTGVSELLAALGQHEPSIPAAPTDTPTVGTGAKNTDSSDTQGDAPLPKPNNDTSEIDPVGDGTLDTAPDGPRRVVFPSGARGNDSSHPPTPSGDGRIGPSSIFPSDDTGSSISRPRKPGSAGGRAFISYVAVSPEDEGADPDGLEHTARMDLEAKAINLILSIEPEWQRTPPNNPGFDLYRGEVPDVATSWCEVKAMTSQLSERPVGLSYTQFDFARAKGEAYWLYIVEHANSDRAHIVRIQNPAGKSRTFTFDHGWLCVAGVDSECL